MWRIQTACTTLALLLFALSGCGSDARLVEPEQAAHASTTPAGPLDSIPPELLYGASPAENLWSPRIELVVPGLPTHMQGMQIAILSDFQLGLWAENEAVARAAVERAVQARPELIVLLGDYLGSGTDTASLNRALQSVQGTPTFAVLGDRDIQNDSTQAMIVRTLRSLGVQLLLNDAAPFVREGDTIWIAGLDPDLLSQTGADQRWILETIGVPDRTPILLTHNPALAVMAPTGRFPVVLAGNTFCGQVEVPGSPRLSWLRSTVFPGAHVPGVDRLFRVAGGTVVVTCGLGYGFVPLRFGSAPEVPLLRLVAQPGNDVAESPAIPDSLIQRYERGTAAAPPSE